MANRTVVVGKTDPIRSGPEMVKGIGALRRPGTRKGDGPSPRSVLTVRFHDHELAAAHVPGVQVLDREEVETGGHRLTLVGD